MPLTKRKNFDVLLRETKDIGKDVNLTKEEKIYLAGIVDGEGCIGLFTRNHNADWVRPHLQISNTNNDLLNWLQKRLTGGCYAQTDKRTNRKASWNWRVACNEAVKIIKVIKPWLVVKQRQAELILSLDLFERSFSRKPFWKLPEEVREMRNCVFNEMKELNWRARYAC